MTNPVIKAIDQASIRTDIPEFRPGDSVRVHVRVIEGSRSRVQVFSGVVIARNASGVQEAFTVRKISFGVGVERTFPVNSPIIEKIEVERRGDVRRAKLYYLRGLRGKAAKIKEKRSCKRAVWPASVHCRRRGSFITRLHNCAERETRGHGGSSRT